jgi:hypothetical protein
MPQLGVLTLQTRICQEEIVSEKAGENEEEDVKEGLSDEFKAFKGYMEEQKRELEE